MSVSPGQLAKHWIGKAQDDLNAARTLLANREQNAPFTAGFHAHQVAEKSIKAVLTARQIPFSLIHDLDVLHRLLPADTRLKALAGLGGLNEFATLQRYPGLADEASWADVEPLIDLAARALDAASHDVIG